MQLNIEIQGLPQLMKNLEGGGGYPLKAWSLTPSLSHRNEQEGRCNEVHGSSSRVVVDI